MIDRSTISRIMSQTGISIVAGAIDGDQRALLRFAEACFEAGCQYTTDSIIEEVRERLDCDIGAASSTM